MLSLRSEANSHLAWICLSLPYPCGTANIIRAIRVMIARRRQLELLIDPLDTSEHRLSNPPNRFAPPKDFLDTHANGLSDPVTIVLFRPSINATDAVPVVLRDTGSRSAVYKASPFSASVLKFYRFIPDPIFLLFIDSLPCRCEKVKYCGTTTTHVWLGARTLMKDARGDLIP